MAAFGMEWATASWYHGRVDRPTADMLLVGKRPGLFLVRDSGTCPGDYVLSVSENQKVSHYIISKRGALYLIGDQSFHDLPSVIEFYKKHFLDTTTLTEVAPRPSGQNVGAPAMQQPQQHHHTAPSQPNPMPSVASSSMPPPVPVTGRLVVVGKFDFSSDDPEDLCFKKGDKMTILRKDEEEWWFARHEDGRSGAIPVPYVNVVENQTATSSQPVLARAVMDRECPYDPTALSFKKGDLILVHKQNENGMWEGQINERHGHFPFKLVELVDSNRVCD